MGRISSVFQVTKWPMTAPVSKHGISSQYLIQTRGNCLSHSTPLWNDKTHTFLKGQCWHSGTLA
jgi:hypothetical protein